MAKKIGKIKPYVNGTRVLVHGRLSFAHLFEPRKEEGSDEAKYQTVLLIPKDDKASYEAVAAAIEKAKQDGIASKWGGKLPKKLSIALKDGDDSDYEGFAGYWYFNAKGKKQPAIVNVMKEQISDPEKVYSGCWAVLNVNAYPYDTSANKGVSLGLNGVMKTYDDEPLSGGGNAVEDFDNVEIPISDFATESEADDDDL